MIHQIQCTVWLLFLTHWGWVPHIWVGNLTIIAPDNGLSPGRRQAIIWTNAGILLIWPRGPNFSEVLIGIQAFSFKKVHLKISSAKWRPFCLSLNVLVVPIFPPLLLSQNCAWYTTGKNMEYTMETLVFDILICWKWLGINQKQVLWLLCSYYV